MVVNDKYDFTGSYGQVVVVNTSNKKSQMQQSSLLSKLILAYHTRVETRLQLGQSYFRTRFVILSNIAVTNNTGDCSIREY